MQQTLGAVGDVGWEAVCPELVQPSTDRTWWVSGRMRSLAPRRRTGHRRLRELDVLTTVPKKPTAKTGTWGARVREIQ